MSASPELRDDKVSDEHMDFLRLIAPLKTCVCSTAVFVIVIVLFGGKEKLVVSGLSKQSLPHCRSTENTVSIFNQQYL